MAVLGIDLGAFSTCVGVLQQNKVHIIADEHNNRSMPSLVAFTEEGYVVGANAPHARHASNSVIFDAKFLLGLTANETDALGAYPFKVVRDSNGGGEWVIEVQCGGQPREFKPRDILRILLQTVKTTFAQT